MPASLLEATLPGDIAASQFDNSHESKSVPLSPVHTDMSPSANEYDVGRRPGDFCNPVFANPDLESELLPEIAERRNEGVRVNEAEMMNPEDTPPRRLLRERAKRIDKV